MPDLCTARDSVLAGSACAPLAFQELVDSLDDVVFRFDERGCWSYLSTE